MQADYLDTTANNLQILQRGFRIFTTIWIIKKTQHNEEEEKKCAEEKESCFVPAVSWRPGENNGKLILALEIDHSVVTVCSLLQLSI